mmetsp:Transcript_13106/g.22119  ORF Transcript_13106/g.22119 Transcript_13106/m.22119 type:complete len:183 (+) Transcript_13106:122-670(+)
MREYIGPSITIAWNLVNFIYGTIYASLWYMDYYEMIESNPVDDFIETWYQWMSEIERMDLLGLPIRLRKMIYHDLEVHDQYGMSDEEAAGWAVFILYPIAFQLFFWNAGATVLLMPIFMIMYQNDRDLFLINASQDERDIKDDITGQTDYLNEVRDGLPYYLAELARINRFLKFDVASLLDD